MIVGIGSDLSDIRRIEASLERFGERFTNRIFTDVERARSERCLERDHITCGLAQPPADHISLFFHTRPFPHGWLS